jgi:hypothetical protein
MLGESVHPGAWTAIEASPHTVRADGRSLGG